MLARPRGFGEGCQTRCRSSSWRGLRSTVLSAGRASAAISSSTRFGAACAAGASSGRVQSWWMRSIQTPPRSTATLALLELDGQRLWRRISDIEHALAG